MFNASAGSASISASRVGSSVEVSLDVLYQRFWYSLAPDPGDAYVAGGGILLLRKRNVLARMTYVSCPCNTDNIKPLAKILAIVLQ